jgi:hypothetical protein
MTGDQSFYSRQRAENATADRCARCRDGRGRHLGQVTALAPARRGRSNTVPACRVPHSRGLAIEQEPRCSGGCRILTQVLITTHGIRDIPQELGKKNSNRTCTLRTVPIARFQRFACKLLECRMRHYRAGRRIDMLANRRKTERRLCRRVAKIQFGNSSLPRDCTITDVSDGGVKLIAEYLDIPTEFTIILSTGNPRQCRLAWRIGCELGAEFID